MASRQALTRPIFSLAGAFAIALMLLVACAAGVARAEPPKIIISNPAQASQTTVQTPAFEGETDDSLDEVVLDVYAGSTPTGPAVQTLTAIPSLGAWSTGPAQTLSDGTYTAQASQEESFSQETGTSVPITFTVDTEAPAVTLDPVPTPSKDTTPSLSGKAGDAPGDVPVVELNIYAGEDASGTPLQTIPVATSGNSWSSSPVQTLPDGTYTAQASQSDEAGNVAVSATQSFTIDTTAPQVSIAAPSTGSLSASHSTLVEGSSGTDAGDSQSVTLEVFAGAAIGVQSPEKTVVVQASAGHWSTTLTGLSDGAHTLLAEQSDQAGNSGASEPVTFTVDTVAPAVTLNSLSTPTADKTPSFSGKAGVASGDLAAVHLKLYAGATASGSPIQTITATPSGTSWSSGPVQTLADGTYTAQAEQSDSAGNTGKSGAVTFRLDTTPPTVTISAPASGSLTKSSSPVIEGTAGTAEGDSHSVTLELFAGATIGVQSPEETIVVQASNGHWTATLGGLANGAHTVRAAQSDNLGNTGQSAPVTFTLDTVAPAVTMASVATPTAETTPSFSGKAGVAGGDLALVKVKLYAGGSVSGNPIQTCEATPNEANWSCGPFSTLSDGTYTVQAEQSDEAGNLGKSSAQKFVVKSKGPKVSLTALPEFIDTASPTISGGAGAANGDLPSIKVKIYTGTSVSGENLLRSLETTANGTVWTLGALVPSLADGTYTVQAEQSDELHDLIRSTPSTFTVDTLAPIVSMASVPSPTSDSMPSFNGSAGTAAGDLPALTLKIYAGASVTGPVVQTVHPTASGGGWSAAPAGSLGEGLYTVQLEQTDKAGNVGKGAPVSFEVIPPAPAPTKTETVATTPISTPPPDSPPVASFTWLPATPKTGESIALVSNSTDASSPITGFAWSVGGAAFQAGGPVLSTSFATAGNHTVHLLVTAADGQSSTATETIPVSTALVSLMQPFPIVRIAGSDNSRGVRIRLLSVQAPPGAKISIKCRGRGCPSKSESRTASSSAVGVTVVEFKRFERTLRAGIVLEIRVYKAGRIGKYTRFQIRRNKLPERLDTCLSPSGSKPTKCPAS
jgi:hypothetical protein